jgi:hypothetical protein
MSRDINIAPLSGWGWFDHSLNLLHRGVEAAILR